MARAAHFIIASVGTAGDTLPLLALAARLAAAGHEVEFLGYDAFARQAAASGAHFHQVGGAGIYEVLAKDVTIWYWHSGFRSLWKYLAPAMADTLAHVARLRRADTVLVASTGALGLRLAQEKYGLPLVTVHTSPFCMFSRHENVIGALGPWSPFVPLWARGMVMNGIDHFFVDAACRGDVNRLRRTLGLAPTRHVFTRWLHSPQRVVCSVPGWFAEPQADWPAKTTTVPFPIIETPVPWEPGTKLAAFLAGGSPPVVFAACTGAGAALTFFARAVEAARLIGRRALLVTRWPEQIPRPLPDNVCQVDYAPFDQLLPHAAAIVHNGGIGTVSLAMRAGIPQVIVPFAYDQFYNGWRLAALGGGVVVRRQRTAAELATAIVGVVDNPRMRTPLAENQHRTRESSHGVTEMCRIVEAMIP
jgi:rhamnosyltransferase subunit B